MGEQKNSGRGGPMQVDSKLVRELADMLAETGLTEIEVEDGDRKIRVSRASTVAATAAAAPVAVAPAAQAPAAAAPVSAEGPAGDAVDLSKAIKSPMVGTAYLSGEPGAAPFIKEGDSVKAGDTLLIVEAMKVMNPISAPKDGKIAKIMIENAQPVEYDQPLVLID